jgi:hypothetical protein
MPQVRQLAADERSIARIMGMVQRVLDDRKGEENADGLAQGSCGAGRGQGT